MDRASRVLLRSAAKILIDVMNHGETDEHESKRVHAAYRRIMLALNMDRQRNN